MSCLCFLYEIPSKMGLKKTVIFVGAHNSIYRGWKKKKPGISIGTTPHPVTVTTRIITFLVGNPYKPSFATVTGWGVDPTYPFIFGHDYRGPPHHLTSNWFSVGRAQNLTLQVVN